MINGMMYSPGAIRRFVGTLAVTVFLSACATPEPLKRSSTVAVPEDETARYLEDVRARMMKLWLHPCGPATTSECEYQSAELDLEIGLRQSGEVYYIKVVRSSGIGIYDSYAVNAIRLAAPYPPVPAMLMARAQPEPDTISTAGLRAGPPPPIFRMAARFTYLVDGRKIE